jgi:type IV secretory pathway VirB2 component (pilin)
VSAWRARRRDVLQALGLAGTVLVAGWLSLAAVLGPVLTWIARPVWIVAWFFYLVLVWAVYEVIASGNVPAAARQWWRSHLDLTVGVVIVLIAALAVATVSTASNAAQPKEVFGRTTSELSTATLDWLARRSVRSVLVRPDGLGNGVHYPAIVAALRRAGYTVYLPEGFGDVLLPRHSISGHKADVALVVAAGDDHIVNWTGNAAVLQIAAISPASVAELTAGVVPVAVFAT